MIPLSVSCLISWLVTALIGFITFVTVKHYLRVRSLPPGPFSYPVLGNLLALRGKNVFPQHVLREYGKTYKDLYTFWLGPEPTIIVLSWDMCKEALLTKKNDFSGRVVRHSSEMFVESGVGVIGSDFGPCWETLRKVMVSAVRKYAVSQKLSNLVTDVVDTSVNKMIKEGKPVEMVNYAYLMLYNIMASSAFGQRYEMDDPELVKLRRSAEDMMEEFLKGNPADAIPFLKWFFHKRVQKLKRLFSGMIELIGEKYHENKKTYKTGVVRDFADALLLAKEEAEAEGEECSQYLTDKNLTMVLNDFFSAGVITTKTHLLWILLFICNNPEMQKKMQAEIDQNIGTRTPQQEDKMICPYTYAVIMESLRFRPVGDMTMEHKAIQDTELGGYKIPKDTSCLFHILSTQRDESIWKDPEEFKAERFLDSEGQLNTKGLSGFMAFGIGSRSCAGKKLALANVFLIVTRLLQTVTLELENGPGSADLNPEPKSLVNIPYSFSLLVKKRVQVE